MDAMLASDVAALDLLIADGLVFTLPDGSTVDKHADLDAHRTGATRFEQMTKVLRTIDEHAGSGDTETVAQAVIVTHGQRIETAIRYKRSWGIVDGRWQVHKGSATVAP